MTSPFFSNPDNVARLAATAASWLGTPFLPFTAVKGKGGGVDCARLVYCLLHESGAIIDHDFTKDRYAIRSDGKANLAIILRIVASLGLMKVWEIGRPDLMVMAGDVLIYNDNKERNHMGVASNVVGKFWHCVRGPGVIESRMEEVEYRPHLAFIWRAIIQEKSS